MIRDIQKCIHIIEKYGSEAEVEVANQLRGLTWDHNQNRTAHEVLKSIVDDYLLKTANSIKEKVGNKEDWYMQDDELHVYRMDDYEWWLSNLTKEETLDIYIKEYGISEEDVDIDEIIECDLDKDGMFWNFNENEQPENEILIKALLNGEHSKEITFKGKQIYLLNTEGAEIWVPFRRAIELAGRYEKPYMLATSER